MFNLFNNKIKDNQWTFTLLLDGQRFTHSTPSGVADLSTAQGIVERLYPGAVIIQQEGR